MSGFGETKAILSNKRRKKKQAEAAREKKAARAQSSRSLRIARTSRTSESACVPQSGRVPQSARAPQSLRSSSPQNSSQPLLVVDGYNVMRASSRYDLLIDTTTDPKHFDTDPFDRARERVIADVAAYAQKKYECYLVFDGGNNLSDIPRETKTAGIHVVYSRAGETADDVIERLVYLAHQQDREVVLVTSDMTIRQTVASGVATLSAQLLVGELHVGDEARDACASVPTTSKMTLEERISLEARAKLFAWARES